MKLLNETFSMELPLKLNGINNFQAILDQLEGQFAIVLATNWRVDLGSLIYAQTQIIRSKRWLNY